MILSSDKIFYVLDEVKKPIFHIKHRNKYIDISIKFVYFMNIMNIKLIRSKSISKFIDIIKFNFFNRPQIN